MGEHSQACSHPKLLHRSPCKATPEKVLEFSWHALRVWAPALSRMWENNQLLQLPISEVTAREMTKVPISFEIFAKAEVKSYTDPTPRASRSTHMHSQNSPAKR